MLLANFEVGIDRPFFLIAGPCVIEGETLTQEIAGRLKEITGKLNVPFIFKASYDKANRTSVTSFRGTKVKDGCQLLAEIGGEVGAPVTTDVHSPQEVEVAAPYIDIIQIPAFLCRQTDLIVAAGASGRVP